MKPINITVKSKKFDAFRAQWSLRLTDGEYQRHMCDTTSRPDATNITVVAELAAVWTALQLLYGYKWVEIRCSNETEAVLTGFLYHKPAAGYEKAYRHFKHFVNKHDLMINPDRALQPMVKTIMELNPAMRSRVRRASQLVTIGAISPHKSNGYTCWTKSHPDHPYHIQRGKAGLWECNCPDSAPTMLSNKFQIPLCKHLLAAMMNYRIDAQNVRQVVPYRLAA